MLVRSSTAPARPGPATPRRPFGSALLLGALLVGATACGSDELSDNIFVDPTEIAVDPDDFLGEVSCSPNPGAARSYVMTLVYWETDLAAPFILGSSRASSCAFVTGFRNVIPGSQYSALVDVYDVPPDTLFPFGGSSSGARQMLDGNGNIVDPRWQTRCGEDIGKRAIATQDSRIFTRPCDPLSLDGTTATQLVFSPTLVLGTEAPCDVAPAVDLSFDGDALPPTTGLACDAEPVVYDAEPGTYQIYASVDDGTGVMGTTCLASVTSGSTATPTCGDLTTLGNARVDLAGLEATADVPLCPTGSKYDVFDGDAALNAIPLACGTTAQLGPFAAGDKALEVTIYDAMGTVQDVGATCSAAIQPGRTVDASCSPSATAP